MRKFADNPEAWEVRRILKAKLPASELETLKQQLAAAAAARTQGILMHDAPRLTPGYRLQKSLKFPTGERSTAAVARCMWSGPARYHALIRQNGSGKSTLVDALLTLFVRPVVQITTSPPVLRRPSVMSGPHQGRSTGEKP